MKANFVAYKGNSTVMKAVNAGQIDGGVIYHYYRFVDQSKTGENSKNTQLYYFKHQDPGAFVSLWRRRAGVQQAQSAGAGLHQIHYR
jgi:iron(III) transport system substrate-binding protein